MATTTQYNPNEILDRRLFSAGASKTIYALVTPEIEAAKRAILGNSLIEYLPYAVRKLVALASFRLNSMLFADRVRADYFDQFRDAWTKKQDRVHRAFFDTWHEWSKPLVDLDREQFKFFYPTGGASEPLKHIIYDYGNIARVKLEKAISANDFAAARNAIPKIHIFKGEYEGYKAYAEAAQITVVEHDRGDWKQVAETLPENEWFFLSQPSAIDGNVWHEGNEFLRLISSKSSTPRVIMDMTYVGAIAKAPAEKFAVSEPCVRNVVFSLSKPFGVYYDRIGGVFSREQDLGLFGNIWFKGLFGLMLGTELMKRHDVFDLPRKYHSIQSERAFETGKNLGMKLKPSDVYIMAIASETADADPQLAAYLHRPGLDKTSLARVCLTKGMAETIGTAGPTRRLAARSAPLLRREEA